VATDFVQDAEEGRAFVMDEVDRYLEQVLTLGGELPAPPPVDPFSPPELTPAQLDLIGQYTLDFFRRLGQRTAQFHKVLAGIDSPAFTPEPVSKFFLRSIYQTMRNLTHQTAQGVSRMAKAYESGQDQTLLSLPVSQLLQRFSGLLGMEPMGVRIRIHGDFQLDNVLHTGKDFILVDFDGDVRVPMGERIIKRSALRDVASMISSIGITVDAAFRRHLARNPMDRERLGPWLALWRRTAILTYLASYLQDAGKEPFLPQHDQTMHQLLVVFLLEHNMRLILRGLEEAPGEVANLLEATDFLLELFA
jgi:maltose alpha-D-glucosyltransferase/alpha-amylase